VDRDGEDEVKRELQRVVDRLSSLPLAKTELAADDTMVAAQVLVDQTRLLTGEVPAEAQPPRLGSHGLGAMLAVLGREYLHAARASRDSDPAPVLDALVTLRRALP
jgi:hypothetical protein